jgi:hypothetical protein
MHNIWWEQAAFIQMYQRNEYNLQDHLSFIEQRKIIRRSYRENYQVGDFVLHTAGFGYGALVSYLKEKGLAEV